MMPVLENRKRALGVLGVVVLDRILIRHALLVNLYRGPACLAESHRVCVTLLECCRHHDGQCDDAPHQKRASANMHAALR
jgi:hypothetical protein